MSTLSGLLLRYPEQRPFDAATPLLQANQIAGGQTANQTALLTLADLKAKQQAEQALFERIQNDPEVARQLFSGSTIGSLPTTGGPPGAGPLTQQTTMPGQPPGAPQVIPGGQDLSQFATQAGPPQSTIASLGTQPQGGMPGPQNPLLEMARTNPRAAMMLQQQLEGRQDADIKRQEQRLKIGVATLEYVGQEAQGVTDQASLDAMRSNLQSQGLGKYAAQLPQLYSKDAMAPFIAKATSVKDTLELQTKDLVAQAALMKQRREQANIPNYTGDAQLDALIYTRMKDQPAGTIPSREIVDDAIKQREADKLRVSQQQGAASEALKPLGETQLLRFNTLTQAEDTVKKLTTEFTPEERKKFVGMGGMTMGAQQLQQLYADATGGKADPKFARFAALVALAKAEAFSTAGKALTDTEAGVVYGYIPTGKEYSAEEFEQKLTLAQERVPSMLDRELKLATTPRSELPGMRQRGELGASTRQPQGQAPAPSSGKPVGQMSKADLLAEKAAILARGGK